VMSLRLIFMGTPEFAVPTLLELVAHGHQIAAVYTRAAKPAGRGMKLQMSPVESEARRLALPVLTPTTLKTPEALQEFRTHQPDAAVVVAYGMILPQAILDAPKLGCFNLHASLLPRWRGAGPINRAIMAGDAETGVMVMKMDAGLDTGDVAMAERCARWARSNAACCSSSLNKARALPMPPRSTSQKRISTGIGLRARCCAIFTACRHFPAHGVKCRSKVGLNASSFCAAKEPMDPAHPRNCSMIV
jgi:methionyl-tRNA formyltransferase